ncbi:MAG: PQQ-dependent sugar dehydrogenase [Verrucomicrobiota bacterium]
MMRITGVRWELFLLFLAAGPCLAAGPLQRVPNTTLAMPATPPSYGYTITNAFGTLTFPNPVVIATPPDETNRLFIVEQGGRISVITNLAAPTRSIFLDISSKILGGMPTDERGLLGLAFHPGYATNGLFYVYYTGTATTTLATNALHDILARYQVSSTDANVADPNSELRLIIQADPADNHNGGDLHFGPDGYLYLSLGDGGGGNDQYGNAQHIDQGLFSGILRLDVDKRPGNLAPNPYPSTTTNYSIPADNPFVGATSFNGSPVNPLSVRTEYWAVGLRNPYRFSFDPVTGLLYCGDVGQDAWEEINIIGGGGNYGWSFREGNHAGPRSAQTPAGFTSVAPIQEYAHGSSSYQGYCVIGGLVYRGQRFSQLYGKYVFSDYVNGNFWVLSYDGTNTVPYNLIASGEVGISSYGTDPRNGDILMTSQNLDLIRRLVYSTNVTGTPLPPTLADAGVFSDLTTLTPNPGIVPYDINVPFWSDNAIKSRWFSVPDISQTIGFNPDGNWQFPTGTVWVKHFDLQLTNGVPSSARRLETRLLVRNSSGVYGVTYRWGTSTTNATLVPDAGLDESFVINDGGNLRTQVWHYPSRSECLMCHTALGGYPLGFGTAQLNRDYNYGGSVTNEIAALSQAGYFSSTVSNLHLLRALANPTNTAVSLEYRVRSYLAANCVQCHQPGGVPTSYWDARITTPGPQNGIINGPLVDEGGNPDNRVIAPGSLANSRLYNRVAQLGSDHMPPLGTSVINTQAVQLLADWITNDLPSYQSLADWQASLFIDPNGPDADPTADPDGDGAPNYLEYLTGTGPWNPNDFWRLSTPSVGGGLFQVKFTRVANRAFEVQCSPTLSPANWTPLNVAANAPWFSATNGPASVPDTLTNAGTRYYRVRVYEP